MGWGEVDNGHDDPSIPGNHPSAAIPPTTSGPEAALLSAPLFTLTPPPPLNDHDPHASTTGAVEEPQRKQQKAHLRRKRKREEYADGQGHNPRAKTKVKIVAEALPLLTTLVTEELRVACGAYEAFRKEVIRGLKVAVTPAKGLGLGIRYIRINPNSTK